MEYRQTSCGAQHQGFTAKRRATTYQVRPVAVKPTVQPFWPIVEVPVKAHKVPFHAGRHSARYREARQDVDCSSPAARLAPSDQEGRRRNT